MLSAPTDKSCVLLADNTELICESSKELLLQSYLYSSKLKHTHSVKLFTVCTTNRRIVWRAPLFGGGSSEDAAMDLFFKSKEFLTLISSGVEHVFLLTDRGILRYRKVLQQQVHHLSPGLLPEDRHYPEGHCVWKQVRVCFLASTEYMQWQQGYRSDVEISNREMKLHPDFSHSGLSHSELRSLEFFVEIMCAMANVPHVCPFQQMPHPSITPSKDVFHHRLDFFANLYSKQHKHTPLIDFSLKATRVAEKPSETLSALWDLLMEIIPSDLNVIKRFLKEHAQSILHSTKGDVYCSELLDYSKAIWTHDFIDHRAHALVRSHYVLLVQLCSKPAPNGRSQVFVQAVVHPSVRSTLIHVARISMWQTLRNEPFSLLSSKCSCEDGYVRAFFMINASCLLSL